MDRSIVIIICTALFVIISSFASIHLYINFHADATESGQEAKAFEYYYNEAEHEEPVMSDTGAYLSTPASITAEALNEIKQAKKDNDRKRQQNSDTIKAPQEPDTEPGSYTQLINRDYTLPEDYRPEDLTEPDVRFSFQGFNDKRLLRKKAAEALEELFAAAEEDDCILYGVSGFRSYERQSEIYSRNLWQKGEDYTNLYSAQPGTSEHQSGLAIDVSCRASGFQLYESFSRTKEGEWLRKNCWKYGFILRYEEDKTDITGYAYEPWHIRYVGTELAQYLHEHDLCLEEYYGYETSGKQ